MLEDAARWDARYGGRRTAEPSPPEGLEAVELPSGGRCLDVACGLGEQSLWAAQRGFDVVALDVSPVAIDGVLAAADRLDLSDRIDARVWDLDEGLPTELAGACSLVICQRFRDPSLYRQLVDVLAPGGVLVITVLSRVGTTDPGAFHAAPGELLKGFTTTAVEVVRSVESEGQATLVARRHSTRPGGVTA